MEPEEFATLSDWKTYVQLIPIINIGWYAWALIVAQMAQDKESCIRNYNKHFEFWIRFDLFNLTPFPAYPFSICNYKAAINEFLFGSGSTLSGTA